MEVLIGNLKVYIFYDERVRKSMFKSANVCMVWGRIDGTLTYKIMLRLNYKFMSELINMSRIRKRLLYRQTVINN